VTEIFDEIEAGNYKSVHDLNDEEKHFKDFSNLAENAPILEKEVEALFEGFTHGGIETFPCDTQFAYNNAGVYVINPYGKNRDSSSNKRLPQWIFVNADYGVYALIGFNNLKWKRFKHSTKAMGAVGQEEYECTEIKRMLNTAVNYPSLTQEQLYQIRWFGTIKILNWLMSDYTELVEVE
jgi:hypothetical protein